MTGPYEREQAELRAENAALKDALRVSMQLNVNNPCPDCKYFFQHDETCRHHETERKVMGDEAYEPKSRPYVTELLSRAQDLIRSISDQTDPDNPESYRCDDREGCLDSVHDDCANEISSWANASVSIPAVADNVRRDVRPRFVVVSDGLECSVHDLEIRRDLFPTLSGNRKDACEGCGLGTAQMIAVALNFYAANASLSIPGGEPGYAPGDC